MAYTLTVKSYSDRNVVLTLSSTEALSTAFNYKATIYSDSGGTQVVKGSGWVSATAGDTELDFSVTNVPSGSYYAGVSDDSPATIVSPTAITLTDDTPKTATQTQWEDLAGRIKAKADSSSVPIITMTTTDPGEGSALAANTFIGVYQ